MDSISIVATELYKPSAYAINNSTYVPIPNLYLNLDFEGLRHNNTFETPDDECCDGTRALIVYHDAQLFHLVGNEQSYVRKSLQFTRADLNDWENNIKQTLLLLQLLHILLFILLECS